MLISALMSLVKKLKMKINDKIRVKKSQFLSLEVFFFLRKFRGVKYTIFEIRFLKKKISIYKRNFFLC